MQIFLLLIFFSISNVLAQEINVEFSVTPNIISAGDSVELGWQVLGTEKVYLSNAGKIETKGKIQLRPEKTTSFSLVIEKDNEIIIKTATVEIQDTPGNWPTFNESRLRYSEGHQIEKSSFVDFLEVVHQLLQSDYGVKVEEYKDSRSGRFVFITQPINLPKVLSKKERRIGERRTTFFISIQTPTATQNFISYSISALLEYRRVIERTWREEKNTDIYKGQIEEFNQKLQKRYHEQND